MPAFRGFYDSSEHNAATLVESGDRTIEGHYNGNVSLYITVRKHDPLASTSFNFSAFDRVAQFHFRTGRIDRALVVALFRFA